MLFKLLRGFHLIQLAILGRGNFAVSVNVSLFGAKGDGVTDDTNAINLAIAYVMSLGAGTVLFDDKTYLVNGALVGTSANKCRLYFPNPIGLDWVDIRLKGVRSPVVVGSLPASFSYPMPVHGTIIKSTMTDGGAILGTISGGVDVFSRITVTLEDLLFRTTDNPQQSGIDMRCVQQLIIEGTVQADNGLYAPESSEPTNSSAYGLRPPAKNNGALVEINGRYISTGYYYGLEIVEHLVANQIITHACKYPADFTDAIHASHIKDFLIQICQNGFNFNNISAGQTHAFVVDLLRIEHGNGTQGWLANNGVGRFDLIDTNNRGLGEIKRWWCVKTNAGIINEFFKSGGSNIAVTRIGS